MYTVGDVVNFVPSDFACVNTIHRGMIVNKCLVGGINYYTIRECGVEHIYSSIRSWQIFNKKDDKEMKKSDLKNRMVVEMRNGNRYLVVDDYLLAINGKGFLFLSSYTDDLTNKDKLTTDPIEEKINREFDIMKIYDRTTQWNYLKGIDLLWERKEVVTMTFSDIKKKLGVDNLKIICSNPNDCIFECELK